MQSVSITRKKNCQIMPCTVAESERKTKTMQKLLVAQPALVMQSTGQKENSVRECAGSTDVDVAPAAIAIRLQPQHPRAGVGQPTAMLITHGRRQDAPGYQRVMTLRPLLRRRPACERPRRRGRGRAPASSRRCRARRSWAPSSETARPRHARRRARRSPP